MSEARYEPVGERAFELVGLPTETPMRPEGALPATPIDGLALVPSEALAVAGDAKRFRALADGNRSAILPDVRVEHAGRSWLVSIKGVGALLPLFGDEAGPRRVHGESWMGEAPFGAQGEAGARTAVEITTLALAGGLGGASICPVTSVVAIPERAIDRGSFWYRRHRGPVLAEQRLLPSDVRVFHGGSRTLGRDPEGALEALGVRGVVALDAFLDRYLASGLALLTLAARSARLRDGALEGLDYDDAWLDKDAVVAPDGTLHFTDLETLEWRTLTPARIARQLDRNHYELFATLDLLLDVRDAWAEATPDRRARRESVIVRAEMALARDPFATARATDEGLDLVVRPAGGAATTLRLVDRR